MEGISNTTNSSSSNSSLGFIDNSNGGENNNTTDAWRSSLLIFAPCLTAPFSVFGSGCILCMILHSYQNAMARPQHRILFGMSLFDIIFTTPQMLNPLFIPRHESNHIWGATGNHTTCAFQGATAQFTIGVAAYNAALSLYFFCAICLRVSDHTFRKRVEVYMHVSIAIFLIITIAVGLVEGLFGFSGSWCYIAAYPPGCEDDPNIECTKKGPSRYYVWVLNNMWLLLFLVVHIVCHVGIFVAIRRQTLQMKRYDHWWAIPNHNSNNEGFVDSDENNDTSTTMSRNRDSPPSQRVSSTEHLQRAHKKTWAAATQSLLYLAAFLVTWMFPLVYPLNIKVVNESLTYWVFVQTLVPLQGFWNFLVYLRPQLKRVRARHPQLSLWQHFRLAFAYESSTDAGNTLLKQYKQQQQLGQEEQEVELPDIPSSSLSDDTRAHAGDEERCRTAHLDPSSLDFVANKHSTSSNNDIFGSPDANKASAEEEKQEVVEIPLGKTADHNGDHDGNNDEPTPDMLPANHFDDNSEWSWKVW